MPREKLNSEDRREIVRLKALGAKQVDLARQFGVTERSIRLVLSGAPAQKSAPRRRPKSAAATSVSLLQVIDALDRDVELLEGVDTLLETGRAAAARAAMMVSISDIARDLEIIAGKPPTPIADDAFGCSRRRKL